MNLKKLNFKKFNLFEKSESDGQQFFCWALQAMKLLKNSTLKNSTYLKKANRMANSFFVEPFKRWNFKKIQL